MTTIEWLVMIGAGIVLAALLTPVSMLLVTFFVLVPLAHLAPPPTMLARVSLHCPFSRRDVSATFVTSPESAEPIDVLQCSLFGDAAVQCQKDCLALAVVGWAPSPIVSRFSLVSDGAASLVIPGEGDASRQPGVVFFESGRRHAPGAEQGAPMVHVLFGS
jgi:hypothetical protein